MKKASIFLLLFLSFNSISQETFEFSLENNKITEVSSSNNDSIEGKLTVSNMTSVEIKSFDGFTLSARKVTDRNYVQNGYYCSKVEVYLYSTRKVVLKRVYITVDDISGYGKKDLYFRKVKIKPNKRFHVFNTESKCGGKITITAEVTDYIQKK